MNKTPLLLSFDYDWTLVYASPVTPIVFHEVLVKEGYNVTYHQVRQAFIALETKVSNKHQRLKDTFTLLSNAEFDPYIIAYYIERLKLIPIKEFSKLENPSFEELARLEELAEMVLRVAKRTQRTLLYDDVIPSLEKLTQHNVQLYICSANNSLKIANFLEEQKIGQYFTDIITPDRTLHHKSENFPFLLKKRSNPDQHIVHIGDDIITDGITAQQYGISPIILIRSNHFLTEEDILKAKTHLPVVANLEECIEILREKSLY